MNCSGRKTVPIAMTATSNRATNVRFDTDTMSVTLVDGRVISVPLVWFSRLMDATPDQRNDWRLIGRGVGIHWESLDEDISIAGLLALK